MSILRYIAINACQSYSLVIGKSEAKITVLSLYYRGIVGLIKVKMINSLPNIGANLTIIYE